MNKNNNNKFCANVKYIHRYDEQFRCPNHSVVGRSYIGNDDSIKNTRTKVRREKQTRKEQKRVSVFYQFGHTAAFVDCE